MRYFLAFLVLVALIFVLILLFFGGGKSKAPLTPKTLDSYATTDAEVQLTIDGPINANQNHQGVHITVSRDDVTFEQLQGYDGDAVNTQIFANTESAYTNFLLALAHAGFTKGNNDPNARDERGFCPEGERYVFELTQDNKDIERYWSTSCGAPQTYQGAVGLTLDLFKAQVPNFIGLTQNIVF
jgi:hypothetical protein